MEYRNQFQPTVVTDAQTLPTWVRWTFRFYAVYTLFLVIVTGANLVYSLIINNQNLMGELWGETFPLETIVIASFAIHGILLLLLLLFFAIGTFRYKRWVLPLILIFSFHAIIVTTLQIFIHQIGGLATFGFSILHLGLALLLSYAAVQYWSRFADSARRLLIQVPLLFLLLPYLVFPILFALFPDDKTINDQDLLLEPVALLAPEDNVYYALPDMENVSEHTQEAIDTSLRIMREEDTIINTSDPMIQSLVEETKELTDAFLVAAERTGYQCPTSINNYSLEAELCSSLSNIQTLALLTSLRAQVETETTTVDEALLTATNIIQFGTHFTHAEQPQLIEYLVGMAVQGIGMNALEQILLVENVPSHNTITTVNAALERAKVSHASFADIFKLEYTLHRKTSEVLAENSNYFYQHNRTMNKLALNTRYQIAAVSKGCDADTSAEEAAVEEMLENTLSVQNISSFIQPNFIGKVLFSVIGTSITNLNDSTCELNERNQELQAQLQSKISSDSI